MFLPGSVLENSEEGSLEAVRMRSDNLFQYGDIHDVVLDIGEDAVFLPKISEKFSRGSGGRDVDFFNHTVQHYGYRKPQLALVSSTIFFFVLIYWCLFREFLVAHCGES